MTKKKKHTHNLETTQKSIEIRINNLWYIYMRNKCTLNKMNKLQTHISMSMNLKNIKKSKKSKTKEYILYDFIYIMFKNLIKLNYGIQSLNSGYLCWGGAKGTWGLIGVWECYQHAIFWLGWVLNGY